MLIISSTKHNGYVRAILRSSRDSVSSASAKFFQRSKVNKEPLVREKFPALLHSGVSIEILIAWIEDVVKRWLPMPAPPLANENATKEVEDYLYKAKQTVLQWNMYSTLALKDLATSGAATTGKMWIKREMY